MDLEFKIMKKLLVLSLIILAFSSCNKCKEIDCFTPPQQFIFQFVDSLGNDIYTQGKLDTNNIDARDEDHHKIDYQLHKNDNSYYFIFGGIGWNTGTHNYMIDLDSNISISLSLDMEEMNENCCTFYHRNSFSLEPYSWQESSTTGIFTVTIIQ